MNSALNKAHLLTMLLAAILCLGGEATFAAETILEFNHTAQPPQQQQMVQPQTVEGFLQALAK